MAGPVIPERYRAALGDDDPLFAMAEAPERLRKLVKGLTEKQLSWPPAPGKWSIKQIVAHLAGWYRRLATTSHPPTVRSTSSGPKRRTALTRMDSAQFRGVSSTRLYCTWPP